MVKCKIKIEMNRILGLIKLMDGWINKNGN